MLSTYIQYVFVFHSTCYICDSRMVIRGQLIVVEINIMTSEREVPRYAILYTYYIINLHAGTPDKQNRNNVVHHQTW